MVDIVPASGYHGHIGVEYEGDRLSENEGVIATKRLLVRIRTGHGPIQKSTQSTPY